MQHFKQVVDVKAAAARARALVLWGRGESAARRELALAGVDPVQAEQLLREFLAERADAVRTKGWRQLGFGLLLYGVAAWLAWSIWTSAQGGSVLHRPPIQLFVLTLLSATLVSGAGVAKLYLGAAHDGPA